MRYFSFIVILYFSNAVLSAARKKLDHQIITNTSMDRFLQTTIACPKPDGTPIFLTQGSIIIQRALPGTLCTLTTASFNNNSIVTSIIPLARSYDGYEWERAAGNFATDFYRKQSWTYLDNNSDNSSLSSCQIILPTLPKGMVYRIASYSRSLSARDEIARFLEMTTFGITQIELTQFYNITNDSNNNNQTLLNRMARWVSRQMNTSLVEMTSHREFFRKRANMRANGPFRVGIPLHPCKALSRWRTFAFSNLDVSDMLFGWTQTIQN